jgi:hypothetical protein
MLCVAPVRILHEEVRNEVDRASALSVDGEEPEKKGFSPARYTKQLRKMNRGVGNTASAGMKEIPHTCRG